MPELVAGVGPAALRGLHARAVVPRGSTLVLVGDLSPTQGDRGGGARARRLVGRTRRPGAHPAAARRRSSATTCWPITGTAPCSRRSGCPRPAVPRTDPAYPAHQLANLVYGGYFSSRLVENIREDKGYTYSARSSLEFWPETRRGDGRVRHHDAVDRARAAGGAVRARPDQPAAADRRRRSSRPGTTPSAPWPPRCPPSPVWPRRCRCWPGSGWTRPGCAITRSIWPR